MKRYLVNGKGIDQLKIEEVEVAKISHPDDVIVDVKACSLNYRDLMVVRGQYGQGPFPPFVPVSDMSGIVKSVGSEVKGLKIGDRVINAPFKNWPAGILRKEWVRSFIAGAGIDGVLAEQVVYPVSALVKVSDQFSFEEASTFPIAGLTAWAAVVTHGKTRPGDWVLLEGTGGVSIFAAQIARAMGAKIVLLTSSEEKGRFVKEHLGVKATFNYHDQTWIEKVKTLTNGQGVNVIVDIAGGDMLSNAIKTCAYGARVNIIGILSGFESTLKMMDIVQHQLTLRGIFMESTEELRAFVNAAEAIHLKPIIDKVFSFDQVKEAYTYLESQKHLGKVVIKL